MLVYTWNFLFQKSSGSQNNQCELTRVFQKSPWNMTLKHIKESDDFSMLFGCSSSVHGTKNRKAGFKAVFR